MHREKQGEVNRGYVFSLHKGCVTKNRNKQKNIILRLNIRFYTIDNASTQLGRTHQVPAPVSHTLTLVTNAQSSERGARIKRGILESILFVEDKSNPISQLSRAPLCGYIVNNSSRSRPQILGHNQTKSKQKSIIQEIIRLLFATLEIEFANIDWL